MRNYESTNEGYYLNYIYLYLLIINHYDSVSNSIKPINRHTMRFSATSIIDNYIIDTLIKESFISEPNSSGNYKVLYNFESIDKLRFEIIPREVAKSNKAYLDRCLPGYETSLYYFRFDIVNLIYEHEVIAYIEYICNRHDIYIYYDDYELIYKKILDRLYYWTETYNLGQICGMIWSVTNKTITETIRLKKSIKECFPVLIENTAKYLNDAIANQWEIKAFERGTDLKLSLLNKLVFHDMLKVNKLVNNFEVYNATLQDLEKIHNQSDSFEYYLQN
mgnify:CR=1 FL=1